MSTLPDSPDLPLRERKKQKARDDILAAARTLIERHGYADAKMREIATRANVSYQTLYNYFPTKASLLEAMLGEDLRTLAAQVKEIIAHDQGGLLPTLRAIVTAYMAMVGGSAERALWRIMTLDLLESSAREGVRDRNRARTGPGAGAQRFTRLLDHDTRTQFHRLLQDARTRGEVGVEVDLDVLADTLFSLANASFVRFLIEPDADTGETVERLCAQFEILLTPYLERR